MTASMRSPSRSASSRRFSSHDPDAFPGTKPLARWSKEKQRPSGDNMPALLVMMCIIGLVRMLTPPASA